FQSIPSMTVLLLTSFPVRRAIMFMLVSNNLFNNLIQRNQSAAFSSGKVRPNHETNINIIARRTGKDVNSHTVLDGIITTIMATRSEERFSRNAETDLVCRLLLEKKKAEKHAHDGSAVR